MVDRHPATLSPEEQDPVTTVALAWKEVAVRGRSSFEEVSLNIVAELERARLNSDAALCDWPLLHAMMRLLRMLSADLINPLQRAQFARMLAGSVSEREDLLSLARGQGLDAQVLCTDVFRVYLLFHERQTGWLNTFWNLALSDSQWPINEGAFVLLEDAARRYPTFITMDRLVEFWRTALTRLERIEDLRRWFYVVGASSEDSEEGTQNLRQLKENFGGHMQDHRHGAPRLHWDHFVEVASAMFRNPADRERIRSFKSENQKATAFRDLHMAVPSGYKADRGTVNQDLILSLLGPK